MENMFLWSLILIFSVLSFQFNFIVSGVNRAFLGLYKAVAMNNVIAFTPYGDKTVPYFDEDGLEAASRAFVSESLANYHVPYELTFAYDFHAPLKESSHLHNYVAITLDAALGVYGAYHKTLHFSIEESPYE